MMPDHWLLAGRGRRHSQIHNIIHPLSQNYVEILVWPLSLQKSFIALYLLLIALSFVSSLPLSVSSTFSPGRIKGLSLTREGEERY